MSDPYSLYLVALIAAHFVGDWYLQPREWAAHKDHDMMVLAKHVGVVTLCVAVIAAFGNLSRERYLGGLTINAIVHAVIDASVWGRYRASVPADHQFWRDPKWFNTIALDQFLHIALLLVLFV